MILSDKSIREAIASGRLGIDPFDPVLIQPSSVDVRLDHRFLVFRNTKQAYIDVKEPTEDLMELIEVGPEEPMFLHPHEFVLGSTIERVRIPDDLVARLEGRSSLGRLGVVIHSSLPFASPVLFLDESGVLACRPIGELVEHRLRGRVVGFDPETFEVGYHEVTNWFKELPDKIYEVRLASGRSVQVTAGHNLFTLDTYGNVVKTTTRALAPGTRIAIPKRIPDPENGQPELQLLDVIPAELRGSLVCHGQTVDQLIRGRADELGVLLAARKLSASYWLRARRLPLDILELLCGPTPPLGPHDRVSWKGTASCLPGVLRVDGEIAWLFGLSVAGGFRHAKQLTIANRTAAILDRAEAALSSLGQHVYRGREAITCCSALLSAVFAGLGTCGTAPSKRLLVGALGWPKPVIESLLEGLIDGDGSVRPELDCRWTTSSGLVGDVLYLTARLGKRVVIQGSQARPGCAPLHVVSSARNRHAVLTSVPLASRLPAAARASAWLSQAQANQLCGYRGASSLNMIEKGRARNAVHVATLERLRDVYGNFPPLTRLAEGDLLWDAVKEVVDTGRFELVYDLEVRPSGAHIENFVAGHGGIFVSNTAGYIDPSFEGHVTLEISNLANLPIALYPGMRIGQISFHQMTTPAEQPYGPARGSKYSGQSLPTASRLYLEFRTSQ